MVFLLGSLSLIQILFLPGMLLLKAFKLRRGVIQTVVFAFGLSLIFNSLWVLLLTVLKINSPVLHYVLFAVETVAALVLYKDKLLLRSDVIAADLLARAKQALDWAKDLLQAGEQESSLSWLVKTLVAAVFFVWALAGVFWVVKLMVSELGTVFKLWDSVVSWNSWAAEWFNNTIPSPNRYPQLIPANFSITYSFLGSTDIWIFAKAFMPLFTIFAWLLMLDLAFRYKKPGIFIGVVILRYMTKKLLGTYLAEGYVDVALLFFSFLTVYTLLLARSYQEKHDKKDFLILAGIFAAGTALAKQNGLLVFIFYPLLALVILEDDPKVPLKDRIKNLLLPVGIGLLILLPWYLLNEARLAMGLNQSNVAYLASADRHSGRSYWERAVRAFEILGVYKYLFPLALVSIPVISKKFRWVAALMIFPYTIIWMFLFSIFPRNLAMIFPFLAMTAGLGICGFLELFLKQTDRIKLPRLRMVFYLIPLLLILAGFSQVVTDAKLEGLQFTDQQKVLLPGINQRLYDHFEQRGAPSPIMTKYPLEYLPGLGEYKIQEPFTLYNEFYANFAAHPEAVYFLVWDKYASPEVKAQIDLLQSIGAVELLFAEQNMQFYQIIDRQAILNHPAE